MKETTHRSPEKTSPGSKKTEETRGRILAVALELYNSRGTASVSTNHVAEAAGISVGNLYYHFRNREEIVLALFEQNAAETTAAFTPPQEGSIGLDHLEEMVAANYLILWKYRFFYRELIVLLQRDSNLEARFAEHRRYGFGSFAALLQAFQSAGVLVPLDSPEATHRLAVTVWLVSEFFITFLESSGEPLPADFVKQGSALLRQVLAPYMAGGSSRA